MLSWSEALILDDPLAGGGPSARLTTAWSLGDAPGCYLLPRRDSHYWFVICGDGAAEMFSKLCAVDLRPVVFAVGHVAQTTAARSNVVTIRADIGSTLAYHVLGDSASAEYMWDCLLDAMQEFNGTPVGLDALISLNPHT